MAYSLGYGGGAFGTNVAPIAAPPSIYEQLQSNVPEYSSLTKNAAGAVGDELAGRLSPSTINLLQNKAASMGVSSGMPGGQFSNDRFLESLGLTSQDLVGKGIGDYESLTGAVGNTMQRPELAYDVSLQNALDAAAPNPAAAESYAEGLFNKYMNPNQSPFKRPYGGNYFTPAGSTTTMPYAEAF